LTFNWGRVDFRVTGESFGEGSRPANDARAGRLAAAAGRSPWDNVVTTSLESDTYFFATA
jgi:hypothetical protein